MKIRAHHLLCMQGFQGYGYSKKFIENMRTVIATVAATPDMEIELIRECDVICAHCPHNKNNSCTKKPGAEKGVMQRDLRVLAALDLPAGARMKVNHVQALVGEKLNNPVILEKLCGDCLWKEKCLVHQQTRPAIGKSLNHPCRQEKNSILLIE